MEAIPTTFDGIQYRSRLEARFAEYLTDQEIKFEYEPRHWNGSYVPDFYLPQFLLFVEVKPIAFLQELGVFQEEIEFDRKQRWICVDRLTRDSWHLIDCNLAFCCDQWVSVRSIDQPQIEFYVDDSVPHLKLGCPLIFNGLGV